MPHADERPSLSRRSLLRAAGWGAGALALGASAPSLASPRTLMGGELAAAGRGAAETLKFARIMPRGGAEAFMLGSLFDDTHQRFPDGSFEVLLWPGDLARLELTGVPYRVTVDDVVAFDAERGSRTAASTVSSAVPGPPRSDYRFLADYNAEMRALADAHPGEVRLFELPLPTLEGRKVLGLEICNRVAEDDGRPVFTMDGVIHAREWPAGELMITFAHDLVQNNGTDARVTALMQSVRTVIVPIVNPDGFVMSREAPVQTRDPNLALALAIGGRGGEQAYWRKNKRSFTNAFYQTLNPDAHGVDANRNFAQQWGGPGTTNIPAGTPQSQAFRGPRPFSEPESENLRRAVLSHQVMAANSSHCFSDLILFPQGHEAGSPDEDLLRALAERQADDTAGIDPRRRYAPQAIIEFAPGGIVGTTADWVYAATGAMAFTYEHGNSSEGFHPAYSVQPGLYERMRDAFLTLGESAADTSLHGVITGKVVDAGRAGGPVPAQIRITKDFRLNLWRDGNGMNDTGQSSIAERVDTRMRAGKDGRFTYHVAPSARPFETEVSGVTQATPYQLTVTTDDGRTRAFPLPEIKRGDKLNVGVIKL